MEWYWVMLITYGISAVLYGFRMCLKYFQYLEGTVRNGTIITNAIAAGLIWPLTLILDGLKGVWEELGPVTVEVVENHPTHDSQLPPDVTKPMDLASLVGANATENLQ